MAARRRERSSCAGASPDVPVWKGEPPPVILVDTMGELSAVWGLADVAFVGGSLVAGRGGQNMMEPAAFGASVLFGPHTANFRETVEQLLARGGARRVADARELTAALMEDLDDPEAAAARGAAGRAFVLAQHGASARTLAELDRLVEAARPVRREVPRPGGSLRKSPPEAEPRCASPSPVVRSAIRIRRESRASSQENDMSGREGEGELNPQGANPQQSQQTEVHVDDSGVLPSYSNFCRVTATPEEVILDFGLNPQPFATGRQDVKANQRIVMNFYTSKRLLTALGMTIQRHEGTFGAIELDVRRRAGTAQAQPAAGPQRGPAGPQGIVE